MSPNDAWMNNLVKNIFIVKQFNEHNRLEFEAHVKGEVQSRITIISKERVKISLQIGAKIMKIG